MYSEIVAQDLFNMLAAPQAPVLVDVRNLDEVLRGVIKDAIHIPLAALPAQYESLPKTEHIVFYCHSGIRSAHAADFLSSRGYKNISHLKGGIIAWGNAGYTFAPKTEG